jgi:two-component system chemotaxis sensor kinase CheA
LEEIEIIREFLVESNENLERLDREMVELESRPKDAELLASIFRTMHTIKGTCGFLGFRTLETITHHAENILGQVRSGQRDLTPPLVSLILETVDALKAELSSIEATGQESGAKYSALLARQNEIENGIETGVDAAAAAAAGAKAEPEEVPGEVNDRPYGKRSSDDKVSPAVEGTIRVDVSLLNRLMNLVGELVLARNQILQFNARQEDITLNATAQKLNLITTELQEGVMRTRMQPISIVWGNLPRVVRDLALSQGKQIELQMDGAETELDKTIIEAIKDPLTHVVRNACDHGIETPDARTRVRKPMHGTLTLSAFHEGGNVNIQISDDGAGIDPQRIKASAIEKGLVKAEKADRMSDRELANLVFLPGFSTAKQISNISGRGVGMDVVKTNIERIGGTVDLTSKPGAGTTMKIKIPLTLAIVPGLVVASGGEQFVIQQANLLELICLDAEKAKTQIEVIDGAPVYRRRGKLLPLAYLNRVLQMGERTDGAGSATNIVVLQADERQFGLVVDVIRDTQEIVVKPLGGLLKSVKGYAGATIMGDGRVALILDVPGIAQLSGVLGDSKNSEGAVQADEAAQQSSEKQELLLIKTGSFERLAVPLSLVARLEEVPRARIERAADGFVVQYRGEILPLLPLGSQLGCAAEGADVPDPVFVVVFADGGQRFGVMVDQILDIVEENVTAKRASAHPSLLGSAVVGGQVTDFLDVHAISRNLISEWAQQQAVKSKRTRVLLAESSSFSRGLVRSYLEIAGHRVIEAGSHTEALEKLGKEPVDVVMTALNLPGGGALALLDSIKNQHSHLQIPVVALADDKTGADGNAAAFTDCFFKFDRMEMSRSLERLATALTGQGEGAKELLEATR